MQCYASLNTPDGLQKNRLETPSVRFAAFVVVCFSTASPDQSFHVDGREKQNGSWRGWELEAGGIMTTSHYSNFRKVVW